MHVPILRSIIDNTAGTGTAEIGTAAIIVSIPVVIIVSSNFVSSTLSCILYVLLNACPHLTFVLVHVFLIKNENTRYPLCCHTVDAGHFLVDILSLR